MIISFIGSQSGVTGFQLEYLKKILELKKCSEFLVYDIKGGNEEAVWKAKEVVKVFTIYPPSDMRNRAYIFDLNKKMRFNKIITPYMDVESIGPLKVKWMPIDSYMSAHDKMIASSELLIAAPKEHKFSVRSAVWQIISKTWKDKKDSIVIPPIDRGDS